MRSNTCAPGSEGCPCLADSKCNDGVACVSGRCAEREDVASGRNASRAEDEDAGSLTDGGDVASTNPHR